MNQKVKNVQFHISTDMLEYIVHCCIYFTTLHINILNQEKNINKKKQNWKCFTSIDRKDR